MLPFVHRFSRAPCQSTPAYGGIGGAAFADPCNSSITGITQINIGVYQDILIQSIQVEYQTNAKTSFWAPKHGGLGAAAELYNITFQPEEQIIAVVGRADDSRLRQIAFLTKAPDGVRNIFGPYGSTTIGSMFIINANVVSFFGRSGSDIDSLGFFYRS